MPAQIVTCRCQKATGEALFDIIVGIINDKEDHPKRSLRAHAGQLSEMRKGNKELLINILTPLMGTAMIVFNGPLSRLNVWLQNWAWRRQARTAGNTSRQSANVLIGIGAILIAITRMMKGLVINFELSAPAANVMLL